MIELDKIKRYHQTAFESAMNGSESVIADLVFLKVAYGDRSECYSPRIAEMVDRCLGERKEAGFREAEERVRKTGNPGVISCEPWLKMLDLWTPEMESRAERLRSGNRRLYTGSPDGNYTDDPYKDTPELNPDNVPTFKALLRYASRRIEGR
jgi:hypothetical protein